jgi:hypothetical protein
MRIKLPDTPGTYVLAVELVHEGHVWFSDAGHPWLELKIRVDPVRVR